MLEKGEDLKITPHHFQLLKNKDLDKDTRTAIMCTIHEKIEEIWTYILSQDGRDKSEFWQSKKQPFKFDINKHEIFIELYDRSVYEVRSNPYYCLNIGFPTELIFNDDYKNYIQSHLNVAKLKWLEVVNNLSLNSLDFNKHWVSNMVEKSQVFFSIQENIELEQQKSFLETLRKYKFFISANALKIDAKNSTIRRICFVEFIKGNEELVIALLESHPEIRKDSISLPTPRHLMGN